MALGDMPNLKKPGANPDDAITQAAPTTPAPSAAAREGAALRGASVSLPTLSRPAAASTGVVGGWGGDGFSSTDFGNDDNAASPTVVAKQMAGAASDAAAVNAAAAPRATLTAAATAGAPNNGGGGSLPTPASASTSLGGDTSYLQGGPRATLISPVQQEGSTSPGVTIGDRTLPYGKVINGVPTFSDGSGVGGIPRTMSDDAIKSLGDQVNIVSGKNFSHALASDALGGTPTTDQVVSQLVRATPQPITGSRPSAADFAASDANAIANRDWRSAGGTAAHNLAMEAQYGGTPRLRRAAETQLGALQTGASQAALQAQQEDAQQSLTSEQGANALASENLRGQYGLAQGRQAAQLAQLTRTGHPVTLSDGTLGVMDPISARVTASTQADGTPAHALVSKDDAAEKRSHQVMDEISKGTAELLKNFVPTKDQPQPSPDQIGQWREQSARANGLAVVRNQQGDRLVNINGQWMPL